MPNGNGGGDSGRFKQIIRDHFIKIIVSGIASGILFVVGAIFKEPITNWASNFPYPKAIIQSTENLPEDASIWAIFPGLDGKDVKKPLRIGKWTKLRVRRLKNIIVELKDKSRIEVLVEDQEEGLLSFSSDSLIHLDRGRKLRLEVKAREGFELNVYPDDKLKDVEVKVFEDDMSDELIKKTEKGQKLCWLKFGDYEVRISCNGDEVKRESIKIEAGKIASVKVDLRGIPRCWKLVWDNAEDRYDLESGIKGVSIELVGTSQIDETDRHGEFCFEVIPERYVYTYFARKGGKTVTGRFYFPQSFDKHPDVGISYDDSLGWRD